jgi:hypothetical protein
MLETHRRNIDGIGKFRLGLPQDVIHTVDPQLLSASLPLVEEGRRVARGGCSCEGAKGPVWENTKGGHGGAADDGQRAFMWSLTCNFLAREQEQLTMISMHMQVM